MQAGVPASRIRITVKANRATPSPSLRDRHLSDQSEPRSVHSFPGKDDDTSVGHAVIRSSAVDRVEQESPRYDVDANPDEDAPDSGQEPAGLVSKNRETDEVCDATPNQTDRDPNQVGGPKSDALERSSGPDEDFSRV